VLDILLAGGWAMLPILLCSAVAIAIILERFWSLRRATVIPPALGAEVREWARTRKLDPQHVETLRANSPLGEILAAALSVRLRSREIMKERVEDTGRHVVHRLERFLNTLGTIALISPLLGLLGTVFGLIEMFFAVMVSGVGDPLKMAGGIGQALVCTAAGLCVAIPAYFFHRYFRGLVADYVVDMEQQVILLMDELSAHAEPVPAPAPASPPARAPRARSAAAAAAATPAASPAEQL
jgi:biopolymer transport protein ExbB